MDCGESNCGTAQEACNGLPTPGGFRNGDGSPENPYLVCEDELPNVVAKVNMQGQTAAHFKQIEDIDASSPPLSEPIGKSTKNFLGTYDGNNCEIKNVILSLAENEPAGLFAVTSGATIKNLKVRDAAVSGANQVGVVIGKALANTKIEHVCVKDSSTAASGTDGAGLVGRVEGGMTAKQIASVRTDVNVGSNNAGGLMGHVEGGLTLHDCKATDSTINAMSNLAGLVGELVSGTNEMKRCFTSNNLVSLNAEAQTDQCVVGTLTTKEANFFNSDKNPGTTSDDCTGKSTLELMTKSTFDPPYDFNTIWDIAPDGNDYPALR